MAKIRFGRLLITGLVWVPVYLDMTDRIGYDLFRFSPLSVQDWYQKIGAFMRSEWVINTAEDWGLLALMLLFIPILLLGWWLIYWIRWERVWPHKRNKQYVPQQSVPVMPVKKKFEPAPLRVQSSALLSVPLTDVPASAVAVQPAVSPPPVPQPQASGYEDEADVQQMLALTATVQADFFPHVNLEGAYAAFALSTDKRAAVVRLINRPDSVWAIDTEVPPEESDWFDQTSVLTAPLKDVISISKHLQENEPDSTALPVVLLMSGKILNLEESLAYFEKHRIVFVRLETVEIDEVPLFTDFLQKYFGTTENTEAAS